MKTLLAALLLTWMVGTARAGSILSFTASHVGDSVLFDWDVSANNGIIYYDVMEKVSSIDLEKVCAHVEVSDPLQTSYHASVLLSRAQTLGNVAVPILILTIGLLIGWRKARKLFIPIIVLVMFISCRKTQDTSNVNPGNPFPDVSSQTQGVFRIRFVDNNGNIGNSDYIKVIY